MCRNVRVAVWVSFFGVWGLVVVVGLAACCFFVGAERGVGWHDCVAQRQLIGPDASGRHLFQLVLGRCSGLQGSSPTPSGLPPRTLIGAGPKRKGVFRVLGVLGRWSGSRGADDKARAQPLKSRQGLGIGPFRQGKDEPQRAFVCPPQFYPGGEWGPKLAGGGFFWLLGPPFSSNLIYREIALRLTHCFVWRSFLMS